MESGNVLLLNDSLIDWFTVTSFDEQFLLFWMNRMFKTATDKDRSKVLQYDGWSLPYRGMGGNVFLGTAMQEGRDNYMLRLSGYAAEDLKGPVFSQIRQGIAKVTRVDVQITTYCPNDWSQWELLVRMKELGRLTGWVESSNRNHMSETVYVGSRTSERFTRVYIKWAGKTRLVRLEIEYKGNRANAVVRALSRTSTTSQFLLYELQKTLKDDKLRQLFEPSLVGVKPMNIKLRVDSSAEKTENWLIGQVLPAFTRHINDHDASGRALAAFYEACKDAIDMD